MVKRKNIDEVSKIVQAQQASGLSQRAYARQNDIPYQTMLRYTRKLRKYLGKEPSDKFIEIRPKNTATGGYAGEFIVEYQGIKIKVPSRFNQTELKKIIEVMRDL